HFRACERFVLDDSSHATEGPYEGVHVVAQSLAKSRFDRLLQLAVHVVVTRSIENDVPAGDERFDRVEVHGSEQLSETMHTDRSATDVYRPEESDLRRQGHSQPKTPPVRNA